MSTFPIKLRVYYIDVVFSIYICFFNACYVIFVISGGVIIIKITMCLSFRNISTIYVSIISSIKITICVSFRNIST